jgi:hypothetical protein
MYRNHKQWLEHCIKLLFAGAAVFGVIYLVSAAHPWLPPAILLAATAAFMLLGSVFALARLNA